MANWQTLEQLRKEGFEVAECDRRLGPVLVKDLYGFGDVMGYDPTKVRRLRLVNGCQADVQNHIRKYLEGGANEKTGKPFPPNQHLAHLMTWFDLFIYSFVLRTMRDSDNKLLKRKHYVCRKWQAILSPEGKVSFEKCPSETELS
jgi:hypothetical protein